MNTLRILQEISPESPREWDNIGTMVCFHRRYNLGDENEYCLEDYSKACNDKNRIVLPLYLYDHSGLTISTTPFSCPWDSGLLGWIEVTKEKIREEFHCKRITKNTLKCVKGHLKHEVSLYDNYLKGEVYRFNIINDEEVIESVGGYFGTNWEENGLSDNLPDDVKDQLSDIEIEY